MKELTSKKFTAELEKAFDVLSEKIESPFGNGSIISLIPRLAPLMPEGFTVEKAVKSGELSLDQSRTPLLVMTLLEGMLDNKQTESVVIKQIVAREVFALIGSIPVMTIMSTEQMVATYLLVFSFTMSGKLTTQRAKSMTTTATAGGVVRDGSYAATSGSFRVFTKFNGSETGKCWYNNQFTGRGEQTVNTRHLNQLTGLHANVISESIRDRTYDMRYEGHTSEEEATYDDFESEDTNIDELFIIKIEFCPEPHGRHPAWELIWDYDRDNRGAGFDANAAQTFILNWTPTTED